MVLMIACMMFDFIPIAPVTAVMIAAVLMVLTGCLAQRGSRLQNDQLGKHRTDRGDAADVRRAGKNGSVGAALATARPRDWAATDPVVLLAGVYFTTSLMTMFISNTATAVLSRRSLSTPP